MYQVFTDFNKFSVQAVDVYEGVVGVRATVAANSSAIVAAGFSTALSLVFEEHQQGQKVIPLPVL